LSFPLILDTRQLGRDGIIAATAIETNDGLALFDTGPESTFDNVIVDLRKVGFELADVRHVFLSHIHFDHAGAAWRFAAARTNGKGATIYVHPRGAPHLIDPTKLIESARRIFGDAMQRLWGKIAPVPAGRVKILQDNEVVRVGQFDIRAVETPGHASHHHVYHWDDNLFGGDIAGVRINGGPPIPPFVPPELNIEAWHKSITRMRELNAATLYLPHFGKVNTSVPDHLDALDERVTRWFEWFRDKLRSGVDEQELRTAFAVYEHTDISFGSSPPATEHSALIEQYEAADPSYMAVAAAIRYWKKYRPEPND
jgi:glyoxylase-like metal-dependent hydrolase (beta-lactamase superfamily II)